ncbi:hypothetical protein PS5_168 [Salmonella phage PS5]|nr:hypothetical protein PS5_168 [Salmonella phage PS5]
METRDVYFVYEQQAFGSLRRKTKFLVDSFNFDGEGEIYSYQQFAPVEVRGTQFVKLFCRCGGCDFNDDGRWMHEYQCNCCGKYVTVYRRTDHGEDTKEN